MRDFSKGYSDYDYDQIKSDSYDDFAQQLFFKVAPEQMGKLSGILYEGGFDSFSTSSNMMNRNNPNIEADRRKYFASLLVEDPKTFDTIEKDNILLFHGTNSNALEEILKNGIYSEKELLERGNQITTGENIERYQNREPRPYISFTDRLDTALRYATIKPTSQARNENSFGMIIGMSVGEIEGAKDIERCYINSDMVEMGINKHVPKKYLKLTK